MGFVEELERAAQPLLERQLAHPFVRGLGDGSLDPARLANWVRQDYLYLAEYARVLALAAARADRLATMTFFAEMLHLTLATEMALHRRYAERFGITAAELEAEPMWPATRAYSDFLVRTAATGDLAELVAALLPCTWGYLEIAAALAAGPRPADARYADWIDQYTAPEFRRAGERLEAELERLAAGAPAERRERLAALFLLSTRYELDFWEMCWRGGPADGGHGSSGRGE